MLSLFLALSASESSSPPITWYQCTRSGCTAKTGYIVADKAFRSGETSPILDYFATLGVRTNGATLTQRLVSSSSAGKFVGSRLYLLQESGNTYEMFNLVGKEVAYDVDVSQIVCGVSASFYTVEMPPGGYGGVGAAYGGGYCDANYVSGLGCHTFDFQHANKYAIQYSVHPCQNFGYQSGSGTCDAGGCAYNAYKRGVTDFWNNKVNTGQKVTVVTQFIGSGTQLTEIRRLYLQNSQIRYNPTVNVGGSDLDSISNNFCQKIGSPVNDWHSLTHLGESFARTHVLVFSLWDSDDLRWLDGQNSGNPPCTHQSKAGIEASFPDMIVTWSNLKIGELDSTY